MRIISGTAGSRKVIVPDSVARPSTDRLREALFSILSHKVEAAKVLDLYAGSGALGLECLSRGADSCAFVDSSREAQEVIKKNLKNLNLAEGRVVRSDVIQFISRERSQYDLVFADPPYFKNAGDHDFIRDLLGSEDLVKLMSPDGILILEDPPRNQREEYAHWELLDKRKYGSCGILLFQVKR